MMVFPPTPPDFQHHPYRLITHNSTGERQVELCVAFDYPKPRRDREYQTCKSVDDCVVMFSDGSFGEYHARNLFPITEATKGFWIPTQEQAKKVESLCKSNISSLFIHEEGIDRKTFETEVAKTYYVLERALPKGEICFVEPHVDNHKLSDWRGRFEWSGLMRIMLSLYADEWFGMIWKICIISVDQRGVPYNTLFRFPWFQRALCVEKFVEIMLDTLREDSVLQAVGALKSLDSGYAAPKFASIPKSISRAALSR